MTEVGPDTAETISLLPDKAFPPEKKGSELDEEALHEVAFEELQLN